MAWIPLYTNLPRHDKLLQFQSLLRINTVVLSDPYAHKCCKTAGIKSKAKHYKYKKPGDPYRVFPNLLLSEMQID
ncbi:MAG: hypothetical protein IJ179_03790, partial [Oscillospiraceae bacterium]|nr:hypothetical protein [Oscillospiraceae bacterium]